MNPMNPMNPPNPRNPVNMMTPGSSQMHDMCIGNEGLLLADPNNCARYFNCSRYAVKYEGFALNQDECPYPQLFSIETGFCEDFPDVNCKGRFIPKAPCTLNIIKKELFFIYTCLILLTNRYRYQCVCLFYRSVSELPEKLQWTNVCSALRRTVAIL